MAVDARRLKTVEKVFGIDAAAVLLADLLPPWMLDLSLLVESVEAGRPPGASADWQPGVVIRLPFSLKISRDGVLCSQALTAVADAAMMLACAAAWNGHRLHCVSRWLRPRGGTKKSGGASPRRLFFVKTASVTSGPDS
jgi:hypothetical protein